MSRNLGETDCARCGADVEVTGAPYRLADDHQFSPGLRVADAECVACKAQYTAYLSDHPGQRHKDLSFRSTFNDEPGTTDCPDVGTIDSRFVVLVNGREVFSRHAFERGRL